MVFNLSPLANFDRQCVALDPFIQWIVVIGSVVETMIVARFVHTIPWQACHGRHQTVLNVVPFALESSDRWIEPNSIPIKMLVFWCFGDCPRDATCTVINITHIYLTGEGSRNVPHPFKVFSVAAQTGEFVQLK